MMLVVNDTAVGPIHNILLRKDYPVFSDRSFHDASAGAHDGQAEEDAQRGFYSVSYHSPYLSAL